MVFGHLNFKRNNTQNAVKKHVEANETFDVIEVSYAMRLLFLMFVTAVCVLFLLTPGSFHNINVIQNRKRFPTFNLLCSRKMCSHTMCGHTMLSRNVAWRLT